MRISAGVAGCVSGRRQQARRQDIRRVRDQRELRALLAGYEAFDRKHFRDRRQLPQPRRQRARLAHVSRKDIDAVRIAQRLVHQIAQRAHRLGVRTLRVQRIGIERESRGECKCQHNQCREPDQDRSVPVREQRIGPASPGETDLGTLVARVAEGDRRGQEDHRAEKRDQHSGAGNQSKLGHAAEIRRHERQKTCRRGKCRDKDGTSRAPRSKPQCRRAIAGVVLGLAESDGELKAEVHGNAHEQHTEPDRNQIKRADRRCREQQRQHQPKAKCREDRHDQPPASDREDEPQA